MGWTAKSALGGDGVVLRPEPRTVAVAVTTAACLVGDSMLYVVLPLYWREAGLGALWQVGVLLALNRFVRLVTNVFTGWFYQRWSVRAGMLWAIGMSVLVDLGYAFGKGFVLWCLMRAAWGCAWSLLRIGGLITVSAASGGSDAGRQMGWYNGVYRLGSLVGALIGGLAMPWLGWMGTALLFAPLPVLCLPWIGRVLDERRAAPSPSPSQPAAERSPAASRGMVMAGGFIVSFIYQGLFVSTLSDVLHTRYGVAVEVAGIVLTTSLVSGFIQSARWAWEPFLGVGVGRLMDTSERSRFIQGTILIFSAVSFLVLTAVRASAGFILLSLFILATGTALTVITDAAAATTARSIRSPAFLSTYAVIQDLGAAAGPVTGYALVSWHAFGAAYPLMAALLLLMWTGLWITLWKSPQSCG
jgi:MFS family permease